MTKRHSEGAFETVLVDGLFESGYETLHATTFDRERAIFPEVATEFIRSTQPEQWKKLEALHGEKTGERVLHDLCGWMDTHGSLATLRHGFKTYGRTLRVAFFKAAHELNATLAAQHAANRVNVTRQLHYSPRNEKSLDVVLSVNGIPVVTLELKNPLTGQTFQDAIRQYQSDRDPRETIFEFKRRTLVHFAADPDLVFMTTRLAGSATQFLPFNRCQDGGGRRRSGLR
jgi:type I restriction enzyme R subunit